MKTVNKLLYVILFLILLSVVVIVLYISNPLIASKVDRLVADQEARLEASQAEKEKDAKEKKAKSSEKKATSPKKEKENIQETPAFDYDTDSNLAFTDNSVASDNLISDYAPFDEKDIAVPEEVVGKYGYDQIKDEIERLKEEDIKDAIADLDEGNTGDDLSFDGRFYPYYEMLNDKGKHVYRQIYANAEDLYSKFKPVEKVTPSELKNIFSAVVCDHPELFWVNTGYSGKGSSLGYIAELDLSFNRTSKNLESEKRSFEIEADKIISKAKNLETDYDKEKYVHDELADKIKYNLGAEMNQSAYSGVVNDDTVCAGYARAFQYIMTELGIPTYFCTGFAGENHAWDIINLDGDYYNVDVTWDDTDPHTYNYFNKSDSDYKKDHLRKDLSVYLPACNGTKYSNIEPEPVDETTQALIDAGVDAEDVFTDINAYYDFCYDKLVKLGKGKHEFKCVIQGRDLFNTLYRQYDDGSYKDAYMNKAVDDSKADNITMYLDIEELQKGSYLVIHDVTAY